MNEILKQINNFKINKKSIALIALGVVAIFLLMVGEPAGESSQDTISVTDTSAYSAEYIEKTEKTLEKILERIDGAGDVRVMLTLESCYENIYAKAYETEKDFSEKESAENIKEEYVIVKKGTGNEECIVIKVYEPVVKGVAVVCEGGDNTYVKKAITETLCALFDISTAKVSVTKMNTR